MAKERSVNGIGEVGQNVARNVRRLRLAQGMTTGGLSALVGEHGRPMYATAITRIEHGNRVVDVDDLAVLAAALGVEPLDLIAAAPECAMCRNEPPVGFRCRTCGAEA